MIYKRGHLEIEAGFGLITLVEGVPGPSKDLAYTCTYVMPEGVYEGVEHQIPCAGRWPDPIIVEPHPVNVPFPAFRVNRTLQPYMMPELPQRTPCPSAPSPASFGGNLLAMVAGMDPAQRAFLRKLIMEGA